MNDRYIILKTLDAFERRCAMSQSYDNNLIHTKENLRCYRYLQYITFNSYSPNDFALNSQCLSQKIFALVAGLSDPSSSRLINERKSIHSFIYGLFNDSLQRLLVVCRSFIVPCSTAYEQLPCCVVAPVLSRNMLCRNMLNEHVETC